MLLIRMMILFAGVVLGYELGIFAVVLPNLHYYFRLDYANVAWITALAPLSAALSAVVCGFCAERFGRRGVLSLSAVLFILGAFECAIAESLVELVFARLMIGVGIGFLTVVLPLYIVELAPKQQRARWMVYYFMAINVGLVLAACGGVFAAYHHIWRGVFLIGSVPAFCLYCCSVILPQSPRWLILHGQQGNAGKALIRLFGHRAAMKTIAEMDAIDHRVIYQPFHLSSIEGLRLLAMGMLLSVFSEIVGLHVVVMTLTAKLEALYHSTLYMDLFANYSVAVVLIVAAFLTRFWIDRVSHRRLLIAGLVAMISMLVIMCYAPQNYFLLAAIFFVTAIGMTLAPLTLLIPAEIFPQSLRSIGLGICVASYWLSKLIMDVAGPFLLHNYGMQMTLEVLIVFSGLFLTWVYYVFPETNSQSLECLEVKICKAGASLK